MSRPGRLSKVHWRRIAQYRATELETLRAAALEVGALESKKHSALLDLLALFDRKDLQSWSVPEVLRLREIRQIANGEPVTAKHKPFKCGEECSCK
jgi:hypothetical protein